MNTPATSALRLVNVGCGLTFHRDWINLDLVSLAPEVIECDLTRGIPFADESCDAVYSSHVLEHLDETTGRAMLQECARVLKPGGILRTVVPDLERIAREYLAALDSASAGGDNFPHRWMQIELYDQVTRSHSGGEMGKTIKQATEQEYQFVFERLGQEAARVRQPQARRQPRTVSQILKKGWRRGHQKGLELLLTIFGGARARDAYQLGRFRNSGEVHLCMYDRFRLGQVLQSLGFAEVGQKRAAESAIADFARFDLEIVNGAERKPDSLYMEARKPLR